MFERRFGGCSKDITVEGHLDHFECPARGEHPAATVHLDVRLDPLSFGSLAVARRIAEQRAAVVHGGLNPTWVREDF